MNNLKCALPDGAIVCYADDTAIIAGEHTWTESQNKMNNDLTHVNKWLAWDILTPKH